MDASQGGAAAPASSDDFAKLAAASDKLRAELAKVIVGQDDVIEQVLLAVFARGHGLLVGVPGLAKTLLISTLSRALDLSFSRIQFTPDLMPSDITGTQVIQEDPTTRTRDYKFVPGPIFGNVILADEINRTPPKTQAALLEAMQEQQVTVGGERHELPLPFFVLATQNPIEQEGTYPLPEAQLDRFMFMIRVDYPDRDEELAIIENTTSGRESTLNHVVSAEEIVALQGLVRRVAAAPAIVEYAIDLTRKSRVKTDDAIPFVNDYVAWGAGPRAGQYLVLGAKARAALAGRDHISRDDVRAVAKPVLRHRILVHHGAEAEGITSDQVVEAIIEAADAKAGATA